MKNLHHADGDQFTIAVPVDTESGDVLVVEDLPCVAMTDRDAAGNATVKTNGVIRTDVVGNTGSNAALSPGKLLHLQANGTLNGNTGGGKPFGYLLDPVGSGETATVRVKVGV